MRTLSLFLFISISLFSFASSAEARARATWSSTYTCASGGVTVSASPSSGTQPQSVTVEADAGAFLSCIGSTFYMPMNDLTFQVYSDEYTNGSITLWGYVGDRDLALGDDVEISYDFDFGDGTSGSVTQTCSSPSDCSGGSSSAGVASIAHTYDAGTYNAEVTVSVSMMSSFAGRPSDSTNEIQINEQLPPSCTGPSGYSKCASEGGNCSFSGSANVAYGCNGTYAYEDGTDGISCSNDVFGDPLPGIVKSCFYKATVTPAPSVSLTANPSSIEDGDSITLSWTSTNATSCSAASGWSGSKSTSGSETRSPSGNNTYSITCTGPGGSDTDYAFVTVSEPAPDPATLEVHVRDHDQNFISGAKYSVSPDVGTDTSEGFHNYTINPSSSGTSYTITLIDSPDGYTYTHTGNSYGNGTTMTIFPGELKQFTLYFLETPDPTVSLTATPSSIESGNSSTLSWSTSDATSCTASGDWSGSKSTSGSESVSPSSSTTYTLTCTGGGGTASDSATVTVSPAFNYSLSNSGNVSVQQGGIDQYGQTTITKTLTAGTSKAVTLSASGVPTGVSVSFSNQGSKPTANSTATITVSPTATPGTYPITVTGSPLSKTTSFNLTVVDSPDLTVSCSASPSSVKLGEPVTLSASVEGGSGEGYTYSWSGLGISASPAPTSNPATITYSTIGTKTAQVTVTDSLQNQGTCSPGASVDVSFDPEFEEF